MRKFKTLTAILMLAMVMSLGTPQAFAGVMETGSAADGTAESPGFTDGTAESPGIAGDMNFPLTPGQIDTPGFDGWIGTGIAALASLFG